MPSSPYAIGKYTAAALRAQPRDRAALRTQLLLGEPVTILEAAGEFVQVRRATDGLTAYLRSDQATVVSPELWQRQRDAPTYAIELFQPMLCGGYALPVTFGARLPDFDGLQCRHLQQGFSYSGQVICPGRLPPTAGLLARLARRWLFVPELIGGRTPTGIDSTGLFQLLFQLVRITLPYELAAMVRAGRPVDFVEQCQEGDLAFFDGGQGSITHVGMVLADGSLLHVSGRVRTDGLDHFGIFDTERRQYTHRLRVVRRWLPDQSSAGVSLRVDRSAVVADARQLLIF